MTNFVWFLISICTARAESAPVKLAQSVTIDGSSPLSDFVRTASTGFAQEHKIGISVGSNGTAYGLKCLIEKKCQIAMIDQISEAEKDKMVVIPLGVALDAILVSPDVSIQNITSDQVRSVFSGKITNWKDLGGSDLPITVWQRPKTRAGIRTLFDKYFKMSSDSTKFMEVGSQAEVANRLKLTSNPKGVITYGLASAAVKDNASGGIKALALDGTEPTAENYHKGKYKFLNSFSLSILKESAADKTLSELIKTIRDARKDYFPKIGMESSD